MCSSYVPTHNYIHIAGICTNELKSRLSMAFQPSAESFGIHRLGLKCSWWHQRQANAGVLKSSVSGTNFLVPKLNLAPQDWLLEIYC